jgi:dienelactone hydrolase
LGAGPIPASNFHGRGPTAVGSGGAMTPLGAFDMAGNVREWCSNRAPAGRCLRGGAWNDATYMFGNITQADPLDRSEKNGFRCVVYPDDHTIPEAPFNPFSPKSDRDLKTETPVSDEVFEAYRSFYRYDPLPLEATVVARDDDHEDWTRESVSFSAAYGDETITAQFFIPKSVDPPFQTVLYFPGSSAVRAGPTDQVEARLDFNYHVSFLLKTGRAVLYPAYRGTHERNHGISPSVHWSLAPTDEFTTFQINIVKDVERSVDYLLSRPDVLHDKIAYYGYSWGGTVANLNLAIENRFAAAVLTVGGMTAHGTPRPEVDYINFAPRITVPILMLNGRYDLALLYEAEVQPMFALLGTAPEDKKLIVYDTDHWIDRREVAKETLTWLDRYMGPVSTN